MAGSNECWASVDWGDRSHVACVVDGSGKELKSFAVEHSEEGLEEMARALREAVDLRGVAVETNHGLVVHKLLEAGLPVYPINPKLSSQWRKSQSVSEAKSDRSDALVLAGGLRMLHDHLRPLKLDDPLTRELAMLCRAECKFIEMQTASVCHLKAVVKEYYPQALDWFDDWTSPTAWDFVIQFPTAEELQKASRRKLIGFLKTHKIGLHPKWLKMIDGHSRDSTWPADQPTIHARSLEAVNLARQLKQLRRTLKEYRSSIEKLFAQHPDALFFSSLPGAGPKLAPRLLAHFGSQRDRYESAQALQELSGTAPVTRESGSRRQVRMRKACRKDFRNTMHWLAFTSMKKCAWARAFYDAARQRGDSHALALRKLAAKWINIIFRMWQDRTTYDDARYLTQLIRRNSPLIQHIKCGKESG